MGTVQYLHYKYGYGTRGDVTARSLKHERRRRPAWDGAVAQEPPPCAAYPSVALVVVVARSMILHSSAWVALRFIGKEFHHSVSITRVLLLECV